MYLLEDVPEVDREKVDVTEEVFRELIELPFRIRSPDVWEQGFKDAGFFEVSVESFSEFLGVQRGLDIIGEMGGWVKLLSILWRTFSLALKSGKIRARYSKLSRGKNVMLRDKRTSKYFGYVLGVGKKPN
jgi:hypothetical protein